MTPGLAFRFDGDEKEVAIAARDGTMPGFAAYPAGTAAHPGILFYMDAVGLRDELRWMVRHIASRGYACLAPNLYYRDGGPSFDPHEPFRQRDRFMPLAARLTHDAILTDTEAALSWLRADPRIARGPLGCIGFCMGGRFVVWAAAAFSEDFRASVSLFGPHLVTDDPASPHRTVDKIRGGIFFGFGATDEFIPLTDVDEIRKALSDATCAWEIEVYPGAGHAFIFPERWCFHEEAATRAWRGAFDTFDRNLEGAH